MAEVEKSPQPLTCSHFDLEKFAVLGWNSCFPNRSNKPKYSLDDTLFRAQPEKQHTDSHSTSQGQKKSLSQDAGCEECCCRRKRVIRQNILYTWESVNFTIFWTLKVELRNLFINQMMESIRGQPEEI